LYNKNVYSERRKIEDFQTFLDLEYEKMIKKPKPFLIEKYPLYQIEVFCKENNTLYDKFFIRGENFENMGRTIVSSLLKDKNLNNINQMFYIKSCVKIANAGENSPLEK